MFEANRVCLITGDPAKTLTAVINDKLSKGSRCHTHTRVFTHGDYRNQLTISTCHISTQLLINYQPELHPSQWIIPRIMTKIVPYINVIVIIKDVELFFLFNFPFLTGEAEKHLLLHLLPVHQCRQSAVHHHHSHPQRYSTVGPFQNVSFGATCMEKRTCVWFAAQECGIYTKQKCYPLAFGVPAALMVVALGKDSGVTVA